jgi:hypothetical protein
MSHSQFGKFASDSSVPLKKNDAMELFEANFQKETEGLSQYEIRGKFSSKGIKSISEIPPIDGKYIQEGWSTLYSVKISYGNDTTQEATFNKDQIRHHWQYLDQEFQKKLRPAPVRSNRGGCCTIL